MSHRKAVHRFGPLALDPDGGPNRVVLSDKERQFFQKTAWEAVQEYQGIAEESK